MKKRILEFAYISFGQKYSGFFLTETNIAASRLLTR